MKKKGQAGPPADKPSPPATLSGAASSFTAIGARGIRLGQARGMPICLDQWTSAILEGSHGVRTVISIQEWTAEGWKVVEVIRPVGQELDSVAPLDKAIFPGHYGGERVLSVFKPGAKSGP